MVFYRFGMVSGKLVCVRQILASHQIIPTRMTDVLASELMGLGVQHPEVRVIPVHLDRAANPTQRHLQ